MTTAASRASGQAPERPFYITGGTLPSDASSYVERQADQELNDSLLRSEYCYVLNTRQMGKSSLMIRTAARLREQGVTPLVLDLTAVGQNLTPDQWYDGLLVSLSEPLGMEDELDDYWRDHQRGGGMQRFVGALRHVVLPRLEGRGTGRLVIFVDEIDAVRSLPFSADEFFAGVRECYNRRATDPVFERLAFCLIGVATPADLIADSRISPFNIGRRIVLSDFTPHEAAPLMQGLGPGGRELLARVLYWTGGHPYMTQRLCRTVAEEAGRQPGGATISDVDRLCEQLFLTKAARDTDDNLAFVRHRLLRSEADLASLLDLYTKVRNGRRVPDDETNSLCTVLRLSGVVREQDGLLRVRNRIYDRVFDRDWIVTHMPDAELRRQRVAYRRGVWRAATVATVFIAAMGALALYAFGQKALAEAKTVEAQNNATIADAQKKQAQDASDRARREEAKVKEINAQLKLALDETQKQTKRANAAAVRARSAEEGERQQKQSALVARDEAVKQKQEAENRKRQADVARANEAKQRKVAEYASALSKRSLVRLDVGTGQRLAQDGDPVNAMLFLAEARTIEKKDPRRDFVHDTRLADILDHLPRLARLWPVIPSVAASSDVPPTDARRITPVGLAGGAGAVLQAERTGSGPAGEGGPNLTLWDAVTNKTLPLTHAGAIPRGSLVAALSADGRSVLVASPGSVSEGATLRVWRVKGREAGETAPGAVTPPLALTPLSPPISLGKGAYPREARLSRDGRHVLLRDTTNRVRAFDAATGRTLVDQQVSADSLGMDLSANGRILVASQGTRDPQWSPDIVWVWDAKAGRPLCPPISTKRQVRALGLSPDGTRLVAGLSEDSLLFDLGPLVKPGADGEGQTPTLHQPILCRSHWAAGIAFRPDSRAFAVGNSAGEVLTYDAVSGKPLGEMHAYEAATRRELPAHAADVTCLLYSPDGTRLLTGSMDQTVRLWDADTGKPVSPPLRHPSAIASVAFSPDGRFVLSRDLAGEQRLWDLYGGKPSGRMFAFMEGGDFVGQVAFSPDARLVASIQGNGRTQVCDAATGAAVTPMLAGRPFGDSRPVKYLSFSPDSRLLAVLGPDGEARVYDARTGRERFAPLKHPGSAGINRALFSPDGGKIYTAGSDGLVIAWDTRTGKPAGTPLKNDPPVQDIALSPDGRYLALAERASAGTWDLKARHFVRVQGVKGWLPGQRLEFRKDSGAVLCWGGETPPHSSSSRAGAPTEHYQALIWEVSTGRIMRMLRHTNWVIDAGFSPDGRRVITSMFGGKVVLWDVRTGKPAAPSLPHEGVVRSVQFTPDGTLAVTASLDASVRLWDALTGAPVAKWKDDKQVNACTCLAISPDGKRVAVGGWTGATLWDLPASSGTDEETQLLARVLSCSRMDLDSGIVPASQAEVGRDWEALYLKSATYFTRSVAVNASVLERAPDDPRTRLERAQNDILRGAYAEASDELEHFARVRKDPAALPLERAVLCAAAGNGERYARLCREIFPLEVDRFRGTGYEPLKFAAFAPNALDAADYDGAIRLLKQTLEQGVGGASTQETLVGLLYRAGRYRDVVDRFEQNSGAAARGFRAPTLLFGAMAYARLGNTEAARGLMALAGDWITKTGPVLWDWPSRLEVKVLSRESQQVLREQGVHFDPLPELR